MNWSQIDLSAVDPDSYADRGAHAPSIMAGVGFLGLGAALWWLPRSGVVHVAPTSALSFLLSGGAVVTGVLFGRWLWLWLASLTPKSSPSRPWLSPTAKRWLAFLAGAGGLGGIVWMRSQGLGRSGSAWFALSAGALVVGIVLSRWLWMQAEAATPRVRNPAQPLPRWFRWVTLALLAGLAIGIAWAQRQGMGSGRDAGFALGAAGLVLGVLVAIWLARRVEEAEAKLRRRPPPTAP